MRIVRFSSNDTLHYGILEDGSERIIGIKGDPLYSQVEPSGKFFELNEVRLCSPVIPRSKVICVGKNYHDHAKEMGSDAPSTPVLFMKPNTAVIGPDDPIVIPAWAGEVHHEAELAVVIKTLCKDVDEGSVDDIIFGYTVANDCTDRTAQKLDGQWTRAKSWDTSCPLGPWITVDPDFDPENCEVSCHVNGEERQRETTTAMVHSVRSLVSFVSQCCTLLPGDVILTGTPAGVGPLQPGDSVTCEISGIGALTNPVVKR